MLIRQHRENLNMNSYKAMQVSRPGLLELVEREIRMPEADQVLIRVEACGICGADAGVIEGREAGITYPRVPGHEVVGRIEALGAQVPSVWRLGQRVGVGRLGGACLICDQCRCGHFHLCQNQPVTGSTQDGGYAEMMLAKSSGLVSIPDELDAVDAAPILCAGLATFNALRHSGAQAGDLVVIQGMGGLGHMAVQYAHKMGFRVFAIGRGSDIADTVRQLGAHRYIDSSSENSLSILQERGGADIILSTITDSASAAALLPGLARRGRFVMLGVGREPFSLRPGHLIGGERSVIGSMTGTPWECEKTLDFSVLANIRPLIETMPLERAGEAYQRMASGQATFRMVLQVSG